MEKISSILRKLQTPSPGEPMAAIALPAGKTIALLGRDPEGHLHLLVALGKRLDPSWVGTLKARSIQASICELRLGNKSARRFIDVEFNAPDPLKFGAPFLGFAEHFVDRARRAGTADIQLLRATFEEWKRAWSQEPVAFTEEWARGLFAELAFLDAAVLRGGSGCARAWRGPEAPQDFSQQKVAFEVKATMTVPHRPVISSLDQLDDGPFQSLYLVCVLLERGGTGEALVGIIERIRKHLEADTVSLAHFEHTLDAFRYGQAPRDFVLELRFAIGAVDVFRVHGPFPKVTRGSFKVAVDERILALTYRLTLTNLNALDLDEPAVRRSIQKLGATGKGPRAGETARR